MEMQHSTDYAGHAVALFEHQRSQSAQHIEGDVKPIMLVCHDHGPS